MLNYTKISGLFVQSLSPRTWRTQTQASLALESLEGPPRNYDSASWSASPRHRDEPGRASHGDWRIPALASQLLLVIILMGAAAIFSSVPYEDGHASTSDRSGPAGQTRQVEAVVFSQDGRTLATFGWDNLVILWDVSRVADQRAVEPVVLPHDSVQFAMAFSPDSKTLAVGGCDSLTIWSREPDGYKIVLDDEGTTYRCLAFSPDGRSLALGGNDHKVRIWDMPSGRERAVLNGHVDVVRTVAFSPDGRRLISTGQDGLVMLWDAIRGEAIRRLGEASSSAIQFGAFSPDGRSVAVGEPAWTPQDITIIEVETSDPHSTDRSSYGNQRPDVFAGRPHVGERRDGLDHQAMGPGDGNGKDLPWRRRRLRQVDLVFTRRRLARLRRPRLLGSDLGPEHSAVFPGRLFSQTCVEAKG
jgi:WD40 repeat protein